MDALARESSRKKLGWKFWFIDRRAQVYLLWLIIVPPGFIHLHFDQPWYINYAWLATCIVGLGYMFYIMRPFDARLKAIFYAWLVPLSVGMVISFLAFAGRDFYVIIPLLAIIWAVVQATGYALNGLVDTPSSWYWLAAGLHLLAAIAFLAVPALYEFQYLLLAILSAWSLLNLWLFRSQYA